MSEKRIRGRTGVPVSFDAEAMDIIETMPYGELSRICRQAVKEWAGAIQDYDKAKRKYDLLQEEMSKLSGQLIFLSSKMAELKQEAEEKIIQDAQDKEKAEREEALQQEKEQQYKKKLEEYYKANCEEYHKGFKENKWGTIKDFYRVKNGDEDGQ